MPRSIKSKAARLDGWLSRRAALIVAFAWGAAEASFFFIVPDVMLTLIACRALKQALKATIAALAGAVIGGALMYAYGAKSPERARSFLDQVPAISPQLISRVEGQIDERGLPAVMIGPVTGVPYKIYAVEWGARRGNILWFILISIPARYIRFLLSVLIARAIARLIAPWTRHRIEIELSLLAVVWITFYSFYFSRLGW
jgi:membrane protein YqaA with SNARE-associated domain